MDRWLTRGGAILVIALAAYLAYRSAPAREPIVVHDAGADAGITHVTAALADDAGAAATDAGFFVSDLVDTTPSADAGAAVLGANAPKQVHLGVILIAFEGAQGAAPNARSKKEARELADRLAADAKTDFRGAVQRGDNGSSDDVGRIPRGVLDPATEYDVFSLAPGTVSDVIETPRGFWIVKRID